MFIYTQSSGEMKHSGLTTIPLGVGYSGRGVGRNNPVAQDQHNVGPIPQGDYRMIRMDKTTEKHGPFVIVLAPMSGNDCCGRSGFLIHGDNQAHDASEGCIILPRALRESIWASGDRELKVVANAGSLT